MWRRPNYDIVTLLVYERLTCCDKLDTDAALVAEELSRFGLDASLFVVIVLFGIVVARQKGSFLLKVSNIDAISGDMFGLVLFDVTISGDSDI